jgi:hypothetical protein
LNQSKNILNQSKKDFEPIKKRFGDKTNKKRPCLDLHRSLPDAQQVHSSPCLWDKVRVRVRVRVRVSEI